MLSKIYLAVLSLSLVAMGFFIFYSWSWLQSIGVPSAAAVGYEYHAGLAWPLLWITTIALLALGNAILWETNRSWAMWLAFVYFTVMAVIRFFWLEQTYFAYRRAANLTDGSFTLGPFLAVVVIAIVAAIVFFDQFLILRLREKMYPPKLEIATENGESDTSE